MPSRLDLAPHDVGRLLDDTLSIYRASFKKIAGLALVILFPFALFQGVSQVFYTRGLLSLWTSLTTAPATTPPNDPGMTLAYMLTGTAALAFLVAQLYFRACLYRCGTDLIRGEAPGMREMLKAGLPLFFPIAAVALLASIAESVAVFTTIWVLGLGALAVQVIFAVAAPAVAFERGDIIGALRRSVSLVSRDFWRVAWLMIGLAVLTSQMRYALMTPITLRDVAFAMQSPGTLFPRLPDYWKVIEGVIQALAVVLVLPVVDIAMMRCYLDLRSRREGMDLLMRARELASGR